MRVEDDEVETEQGELESFDVNLEDSKEALVGFAGVKSKTFIGFEIIKMHVRDYATTTLEERKQKR